jgi:hypothetical protein
MAALNDFTFYNNRSLGGVEYPNDPQAQANLQSLRQYDPNANYRPTYGSDGQLLGYTLDVDASKLPGTDGTGSLGGTSGHGSGADYMPRFSTVQPNMQLGDPNAVTNSPTYGRITDNTNINQPSSLLDTLGPLAVGGFGLAMGGIPALYSGIFGQGAYGGAGALPLDTSGDFYLGTSDAGVPAFQGAPGAPFPSLDTSGDGYLGLSGIDTQPAAPIVENGTAARVGDVIRNGGIPGLDNVASSLRGLTPGNIASALGKVPGLLGTKPGAAGGGLLSSGSGGGGSVEDAAAILRAFYAPKMNPLNDPRLRGR